MRILLIEDDKALCQVLQPTLQAAGFASDVALQKNKKQIENRTEK